MQMKNHLVMIISLAVSIILVVGVLIPVIADNSGNGSNEPAYTNVGEYYYKTPVEGETHTIEIAVDNDGLTITYDSEPLVTETLADEMILIPLGVTQGSIGEVLAIFEYVPYVMATEWDAYWRVTSSYFGEGITTTDNFDSFVLTTDGNQYEYVSGYYSGEGEFTLCIAPTGDYVYANEPIVEDAETIIYLMDGSGEFKLEDETDGYNKYDAFAGAGDCTTILDDIEAMEFDCDYSIFNTDGTPAKYFEYQSATVSDLDTEETEYGIKINGATVTSIWEYGGDEESMITALTHFIVPVNVGETSGGSTVSPVITTVLSVIPLVMIVGLIVGTIGYFIRRQ